MNNHFDLLVYAKTLYGFVFCYLEEILGMGACTYHTINYLLVEANKKNNPEDKKFVNTLIKNFNNKRMSFNKSLDEAFVWINVEKYLREANELAYQKTNRAR